MWQKAYIWQELKADALQDGMLLLITRYEYTCSPLLSHTVESKADAISDTMGSDIED